MSDNILQKRVRYWKKMAQLHDLIEKISQGQSEAMELLFSGANRYSDTPLGRSYDGILTALAENSLQGKQIVSSIRQLRAELEGDGLETRLEGMQQANENKPYISTIEVDTPKGLREIHISYFGKDAVRFSEGRNTGVEVGNTIQLMENPILGEPWQTGKNYKVLQIFGDGNEPMRYSRPEWYGIHGPHVWIAHPEQTLRMSFDFLGMYPRLLFQQTQNRN